MVIISFYVFLLPNEARRYRLDFIKTTIFNKNLPLRQEIWRIRYYLALNFTLKNEKSNKIYDF